MARARTRWRRREILYCRGRREGDAGPQMGLRQAWVLLEDRGNRHTPSQIAQYYPELNPCSRQRGLTITNLRIPDDQFPWIEHRQPSKEHCKHLASGAPGSELSGCRSGAPNRRPPLWFQADGGNRNQSCGVGQPTIRKAHRPEILHSLAWDRSQCQGGERGPGDYQ